MKLRLILLLCAFSSTACAELPPVVDKSGGVSTSSPVINATTPPAALSTNYEMMKRIEQMQVEVQQLTGKVEEQTFQIEELKKQQKTIFTDFDDRIQSIENKSGSAQQSGDTPTEASPPIDPSGTTPPAPAAPEQPTSSNEPQVEPPPEAAAASVPAPSAPATVAPTNPPNTESTEVTAAEKQEYQVAYDNLRNGHTDQSISEFGSFISNHPNSGYTSNAQYWLGEAYRVNLDNTSARKAFNTVVEKHPKSAKVPDALLKMGYIEIEENNPGKAREILTRVTSEFPNSKAAVLAQKKMLSLEKNAP